MRSPLPILTVAILAVLPDAGHLLAETAIELVTVEAPAPCTAEPLCALPSGEPADCSRPSAVALWGPWWAPVVESPDGPVRGRVLFQTTHRGQGYPAGDGALYVDVAVERDVAALAMSFGLELRSAPAWAVLARSELERPRKQGEEEKVTVESASRWLDSSSTLGGSENYFRCRAADVIRTAGGAWIAVACDDGVGLAVWYWDGRRLDARYQASRLDCRDAAIVLEAAGPRVLAACWEDQAEPGVYAVDVAPLPVAGCVEGAGCRHLRRLVPLAAVPSRLTAARPDRRRWAISDGGQARLAIDLYTGASRQGSVGHRATDGIAVWEGTVVGAEPDGIGVYRLDGTRVSLVPYPKTLDGRPSEVRSVDAFRVGTRWLVSSAYLTGLGTTGPGGELIIDVTDPGAPVVLSGGGGLVGTGARWDGLGAYRSGNPYGCPEFSPRAIAIVPGGEGWAATICACRGYLISRPLALVAGPEIFADGFESGGLDRWGQ